MPTLPRISGRSLSALVTASATPGLRAVLYQAMSHDLGLDALRAIPSAARSPLPFDIRPVRARTETPKRTNERLGVPKGGALPSTEVLHDLLKRRELTPLQLTERSLSACRTLGARRPSLGPMFAFDEEHALKAAQESTIRYQKGASLGPLDGIPVGVKEELDIAGLKTMLGTSWRQCEPATKDATAVARLRQRGAVVMGHTAMTEYGMTPLGFNPHRTMPRNPHDPSRSPGGSSSGSGVGVCAGAFPLAIGGDGGGSIRIPSSLCGVFGLKPTFGYVSRTGDPFGGSVAHVGPMGASSVDLARFMDAVAGLDEDDALTTHAPSFAEGDFTLALERGVKGLRIGVVEAMMAEADDDVARRCREALDALLREGAILVPVKMPLTDHSLAVGCLTIGMEFLAGLRDVAADAPFGADSRFLANMLAQMKSDDYIDAQRVRASIRSEAAAVLRDVDVLALPSTFTTAPKVSDLDMKGFLEAPLLRAMCKPVFLGNLAGLPAASIPVGRDGQDLPVGLQIVGDAWDDQTVLQVAGHLERLGVARAERPTSAAMLI